MAIVDFGTHYSVSFGNSEDELNKFSSNFGEQNSASIQLRKDLSIQLREYLQSMWIINTFKHVYNMAVANQFETTGATMETGRQCKVG